MKAFKSVFIAGLPVTGKSTLADKLGEHYGFPVYSFGRIFRAEWAKLYPNKELSFESFWKSKTIEDNRQKNNEACELFIKGGMIGEGRYGKVYEDTPTLLVFLYANREIRAKRGIKLQYPGRTLEEIMDILARREADELAMGRKLYGKSYDYRNPSGYHISLNSSLLSIPEELAIVSHIFDRKD